MALPIINLSLTPAFPARVFGSGPITIVKTGLNYTFDFDISTYSYNPAPTELAQILSYNPSTEATELISVGELVRPLASQAEAEAGTDNAKIMTPLRTKQSVVANAKAGEWAQAGSGATSRTIDEKLKEASESVFDYTSGFAKAVAEGGEWLVPSGVYAQPGVTEGASPVFWHSGVVQDGDDLPLDLPGVQELWYQRGKMLYQPQGKVNDYATHRVQRHATYTGGTGGQGGNVNSAIHALTVAGANTGANEWAVTGVVDSYGTGENVGVYGQGNKKASPAKVWGGVFESRDFTGGANPTAPQVGSEHDIFANGTDANNQRIGALVIIGKHDPAGAAAQAGFGVLIAQTNDAPGEGYVKHGFAVKLPFGVAFDASMGGQASGGAAFRMAAGMHLDFEENGARYMRYAAGFLQYNGPSSEIFAVNDDGYIRLAGERVLRAPVPGWTNYAGAQLRSAPDPGVTTLSDLTAIVGSLIHDLHTVNGPSTHALLKA